MAKFRRKAHVSGNKRGACSLVIFLLSVVVAHTPVATESAVSCGGTSRVVVGADETVLLQRICESAHRAIDFLAGYGLTVDRPVFIEIIDRPIDNGGYLAYGAYDSRSDRIMLMSPAAIRAGDESPQMYGEPFDEVHYAGAVAHEVAHAVMQQHVQVRALSPAPQEYLAHATQMAVLPEQRRKRIIEQSGVGPWEPGDTLGDVYMALEPTRFAVKSYLHLTGHADPVAMIAYLLRARWFVTAVP